MLRRPIIFFLASAIFLLIAGSFYFYKRGFDDGGPLRRLADQIYKNLQRELVKAYEEAEEIVGTPSKIWTTTNHPFFLRKGNKIIAWSSNFYEPEASWFSDSGTERYVHSLRGDFVVKAWGTPNNETL